MSGPALAKELPEVAVPDPAAQGVEFIIKTCLDRLLQRNYRRWQSMRATVSLRSRYDPVGTGHEVAHESNASPRTNIPRTHTDQGGGIQVRVRISLLRVIGLLAALCLIVPSFAQAARKDCLIPANAPAGPVAPAHSCAPYRAQGAPLPSAAAPSGKGLPS